MFLFNANLSLGIRTRPGRFQPSSHPHNYSYRKEILETSVSIWNTRGYQRTEIPGPRDQNENTEQGGCIFGEKGLGYGP